MDQKEKMKADLLKDLKGYLLEMAYARDLIEVKSDIRKHQDQMQCAPNFTEIVECALADSYLLVLMKLYDKSHQAKTIPNLVEKCKANIHLFPSKEETLRELEIFEKKMDEDEDIAYAIKTLTTWRDSFHVHNDSRYFGENLKNEKPTLKSSQLFILWSYTNTLLQFLFSQLSSEETRKTKYDGDLKRLLEP